MSKRKIKRQVIYSCEDSEEAANEFDVVSAGLDESSVAALASECWSLSFNNSGGDVSGGCTFDNPLGLLMRGASRTDIAGEVKP